MSAQLAVLMAGLARGAVAQWKLRRMLPLVLVMMMLTFVAAAMVSVAVLGGFYAAYLALFHAGVEPLAAACIVAAAFVLATVVLLAVLRFSFARELQSRRGHASEAIDAFLDGLLTE